MQKEKDNMKQMEELLDQVSMGAIRSYLMENYDDFVKFLDVRKLETAEIQEHVDLEQKLVSKLDRSQSLNCKIGNILKELDIMPNRKGYDYLIEAIMMKKEQPDILLQEIYSMIAEKYTTSIIAVEKAIRSAIEHAWRYSDPEILNYILGYNQSSNKGKPTNAEFIATIADTIDRIQLEDKPDEKPELRRIRKVLRNLGVPRHVQGYECITQAILIAEKGMSMGELYCKVGQNLGINYASVERSIRTAIEIVFSRGNENALKKVFGNKEGKVTNSEFIYTISDMLRNGEEI